LRLPQDSLNAWSRIAWSEAEMIAIVRDKSFAPGTEPFALITIEMTVKGMAFFVWNGTLRRTFDGGWWRFYGNLAERCLDETGDLLYQMKMKPCNVPELPPLN
jgi:hypothetical protein